MTQKTQGAKLAVVSLLTASCHVSSLQASLHDDKFRQRQQ